MSVTIVSVYPREYKAERPWSPRKGDGLHLYRIPAGTPDSPSEVTVEDAHQKVYYGEMIGYKFVTIDAAEVARDLVTAFTKGVVGTDSGMGPGVFVKDPEQYPSQLKRTIEEQDGYFDHLYRQGENMFSRGQYDFITEDHRLAAKVLKRQPEWLNALRGEDMKECPFCISSIPARSRVCRVCTRSLDGEEAPPPARRKTA